MIALLQARRDGTLSRAHWMPNLAAGVVVGVVALPLAMAFAIASGARPEQGIATAIVASLLVSAFGGSRWQIAGPTGAFVVLLSSVTARFGLAGLQVATLMAGAMLVGMGLARLGGILRYIPRPVILGFTAGIAVIIAVGQVPAFFGIASPKLATPFGSAVLQDLRLLPHLHLATTALAAVSLALLLVLPRVPLIGRVPGPLVVLVLATVAQAVFRFDGVRTIGDAFGALPRGLPTVSMPAFADLPLSELVGPAFTIALLGAIESLLSATVADGMAGTRHDPNQELVGQGLANLATPWFGGFAATGAIARTATNIRNGATGPLSGLVHAVVLVVVLLVFAPLASAVPLAALAAILCKVAWNMSDAHEVLRLLQRAPRADAIILGVTFVMTLFTDLVIAVNIGVILALLQFLRRMADSVEVRRLRGESASLADTTAQPEDAPDTEAMAAGPLPRGVQVYAVDGPLFFAAVEAFEQAMGVVHGDPRTLVIRLRWVPFADATGLQALEEAVERFQHRGVRVMLVGANPRVRGKLERLGLAAKLGPGNLHDTLAEALQACAA